MADFTTEFVFKTDAELRGAQELAAALEKQIAQIKQLATEEQALKQKEQELAEVQRKITADLKARAQAEEAAAASAAKRAGANNTEQTARAGLSDIGSQSSGLLRPGADPQNRAAADLAAQSASLARLAGTAAATVAAIAGVASAMAAMAEAGDKARLIEDQLGKALENQGLASDDLVERYKGMAGALQDTTNVASSEWLQVITQLTQAGSRPESVGMDLQVVKDLAGLLGGDVSQAAGVWSKAIQGNFEALGRLGIRVEENGTLTEKLSQAMSQAATKGGGQLELATKGLTGVLKAFANSAGDSIEQVATTFQPLTDAVGQALKELGSNWLDFVKTFTGTNPIADHVAHAALQHPKLSKATADTGAAQRAAALDVKKLTDALDEQTSAMDKTLRAANALAEAQKDVELARIDAAERAGTITGPQAVIARRDVERRAADAAEARQEQVDAQRIIKLRNLATDLNQSVTAQESVVSDLGKTNDKESLKKAEEELKRRRSERDQRAPAALREADELQTSIRNRGEVLGLRQQAGDLRAAGDLVNARQQVATQAQREQDQRTRASEQQARSVQSAIHSGAAIEPVIRATTAGGAKVSEDLNALATALGARDANLSQQLQDVTRRINDLERSRRTP